MAEHVSHGPSSTAYTWQWYRPQRSPVDADLPQTLPENGLRHPGKLLVRVAAHTLPKIQRGDGVLHDQRCTEPGRLRTRTVSHRTGLSSAQPSTLVHCCCLATEGSLVHGMRRLLLSGVGMSCAWHEAAASFRCRNALCMVFGTAACYKEGCYHGDSGRWCSIDSHVSRYM